MQYVHSQLDLMLLRFQMKPLAADSMASFSSLAIIEAKKRNRDFVSIQSGLTAFQVAINPFRRLQTPSNLDFKPAQIGHAQDS